MTPMQRLLALLVAGALVVFGIAACGSGDDGGSGTDGGTTAGEQERFGMLLAGPRNDKGFYEFAYKGLQMAAPDANISVVDNVGDAQAEFDALKSLSADNELILASGTTSVSAVTKLAPQYPEVQYVVLAAGVVDDRLDNVHAYSPQQGIPAYIGGAVAATLSTTRHVGFVGGPEINVTETSDAGFGLGAKAQVPGTEYSATSVGTFSDPAKAKEAANAQIAAGADAIFAFLDAGTPGVLQAIEESGRPGWIVGAIAPRCEESDAFVGTTVMDVTALVDAVVADHRVDSLATGTRFFGVQDARIQSFQLCPAYDRGELPGLVEELTARLNAGEVDLPPAALK
jgi:basic membrane protein A